MFFVWHFHCFRIQLTVNSQNRSHPVKPDCCFQQMTLWPKKHPVSQPIIHGNVRNMMLRSQQTDQKMLVWVLLGLFGCFRSPSGKRELIYWKKNRCRFLNLRNLRGIILWYKAWSKTTNMHSFLNSFSFFVPFLACSSHVDSVFEAAVVPPLGLLCPLLLLLQTFIQKLQTMLRPTRSSSSLSSLSNAWSQNCYQHDHPERYQKLNLFLHRDVWWLCYTYHK